MTKVFRIFYSHSLVQNLISDQPKFKVCLVYSLQLEKLVGGTELIRIAVIKMFVSSKQIFL